MSPTLYGDNINCMSAILKNITFQKLPRNIPFFSILLFSLAQKEKREKAKLKFYKVLFVNLSNGHSFSAILKWKDGPILWDWGRIILGMDFPNLYTSKDRSQGASRPPLICKALAGWNFDLHLEKFIVKRILLQPSSIFWPCSFLLKLTWNINLESLYIICFHPKRQDLNLTPL